ncbi:hypothetical protein [Kribbella sp. HUAS MG21]|uniref:Uncharacterized protein n=1 Tax=Kribbella sp. HUAS MG21 TaxID=3160966 RepID=A0AAU7TAX1_9ACTN
MAERADSGVWGLLALVFGLAGVVAPFLPMDMSGYRQYAAFPFALPGLVFSIVGLIGNRRAKAVAVFGAMFSGLALCVGGYLVFAFTLR